MKTHLARVRRSLSPLQSVNATVVQKQTNAVHGTQSNNTRKTIIIRG